MTLILLPSAGGRGGQKSAPTPSCSCEGAKVVGAAWATVRLWRELPWHGDGAAAGLWAGMPHC